MKIFILVSAIFLSNFNVNAETAKTKVAYNDVVLLGEAIGKHLIAGNSAPSNSNDFKWLVSNSETNIENIPLDPWGEMYKVVFLNKESFMVYSPGSLKYGNVVVQAIYFKGKSQFELRGNFRE